MAIVLAPRPGSSAESPTAAIAVRLLGDGNCQALSKNFPCQDVVSVLAAAGVTATAPLELQFVPEVSRGAIVPLMDALQAAGFTGLSKTDLPSPHVFSVCDLPTIHAAHDGETVSVRGRFDVHAHGVFLRDNKCPGFMLSLHHLDGGPDVSLCSYDRLMNEFGCPGGNDNGPIVTMTGVVPASFRPQYGAMKVARMSDFENVRTGIHYVGDLAPNIPTDSP